MGSTEPMHKRRSLRRSGFWAVIAETAKRESVIDAGDGDDIHIGKETQGRSATMKNRVDPKVIVFFLSLFSALSLMFISSSQAQTEPFYKDKTIRIIAGSAPGGGIDFLSRLMAAHMGKYIPGNPDFIVQNMTGGGTMVAANYIYGLAKPDGLSFGLINPGLYFDQLFGRKEVKFDWANFTWLGSPETSDEIIYIRSDSPYKNAEDLRQAATPPKCGAVGTGASDYYFPRLLQEVLGFRIQMVVGYTGTADINLAIERGEVQCRGGTTSTLFGREPMRTWAKTGFVRVLVQGGLKRDPRLADVSTIHELMDKHKSPDRMRRLVKVVLSAGEIGRPVVGPPEIPADRVRVLREAFNKVMNDPALLADAKKAGWELKPVSGDKLESIAKEVIAQPPEIIEGLKKILGM
jgi:tripartite-type tricarboxylate transporter receptor subunit TctC